MRFQISNFRFLCVKQARHSFSFLRSLWWFLRQVSGDAAYENYLRSSEQACRSTALVPSPTGGCCPHGSAGTQRILSPREFYLDALRRRYTGVSQCC